jgi:uncharacterized protein (DUF39 family)
MEIIAFAESDDCGPFAIVEADLISIMKMQDLYIAATRCAYRNTPITCEITQDQALRLIASGVQCIDMLQKDNSNIYEED